MKDKMIAETEKVPLQRSNSFVFTMGDFDDERTSLDQLEMHHIMMDDVDDDDEYGLYDYDDEMNDDNDDEDNDGRRGGGGNKDVVKRRQHQQQQQQQRNNNNGTSTRPDYDDDVVFFKDRNPKSCSNRSIASGQSYLTMNTIDTVDTAESETLTTSSGGGGPGGVPGVGDKILSTSLASDFQPFIEDAECHCDLLFLKDHVDADEDALDSSDEEDEFDQEFLRKRREAQYKDYRCYAIVIHETYGIVLLHSNNNNNDSVQQQQQQQSSSAQYQLPGGKVGIAEFNKFKMADSWAEQRFLAGRAACARQLRQQTGLQIGAARFWPLVIYDSDNSTTPLVEQGNAIMNEYKQRLFYVISVTDNDFYQQNGDWSNMKMARNSNECPLRLQLDEELHTGFRTETGIMKALGLLKHFSRGRVTKALHLAKKLQDLKSPKIQVQGTPALQEGSSSMKPRNGGSGRSSNNGLVVSNGVVQGKNISADLEAEDLTTSHDDDDDLLARTGAGGQEEDDVSKATTVGTATSTLSPFATSGSVTSMSEDLIGFERLARDAKQNVNLSFLRKCSGLDHQHTEGDIQPMEQQGQIYYGGYVFVLHETYGMLLLHSTRKGRRKGAHYETPGGRVDDVDFDRQRGESWVEQCYLAARAACVRELLEDTGMMISPDRLQPLTIAFREGEEEEKNMLRNEYKQRLFFALTVSDDDFYNMETYNETNNNNDGGGDVFIAEAENEDCPLGLKLASEYVGFVFENNSMKAIERLQHICGGKVSKALWLALKSRR